MRPKYGFKNSTTGGNKIGANALHLRTKKTPVFWLAK
jgi:hypothetical protein